MVSVRSPAAALYGPVPSVPPRPCLSAARGLPLWVPAVAAAAAEGGFISLRLVLFRGRGRGRGGARWVLRRAGVVFRCISSSYFVR